MDLQQLEKFFAAYETAFNQLDIGAIASLYAGTFHLAGPRGTQVQDTGGKMQIILFIAHGDEEIAMKKPGLI